MVKMSNGWHRSSTTERRHSRSPLGWLRSRASSRRCNRMPTSSAPHHVPRHHRLAPETRGGSQDLADVVRLDASFGLAEALRPEVTEMVWIETPVNPTWDVIDIALSANLAHQAGAVLAVDSTVAPPVTTRPLDLGADLVFHSATKYYNGHSDVLAGIVVTGQLNPGGKTFAPCAPSAEALSLPSRRGSCCEACARCHFAIRERPQMRWPSPGGSTAILPRSRALSRAGRPSRSRDCRPSDDRRLRRNGVLAAQRRSRGRRTNGIGDRGLPPGDVPGRSRKPRGAPGRSRRTGVNGSQNLLRLSVGIEAERDLIADLDQALG